MFGEIFPSSAPLFSSIHPGWIWAEFPFMSEVVENNAMTRGYSYQTVD